MAIKLVPFSPGTLIKSSEANGHNNLLFNNEILTKIEQLIDRDVTRSNDKVSPFVEAYTSAGGMGSSVVVADNEACLINDVFESIENSTVPPTKQYINAKKTPKISSDYSGDTQTSDYTNPSNANNFNYSTFASASLISTAAWKVHQQTFSARQVDFCHFAAEHFGRNASSSRRYEIDIETYDGSVWTSIHTENSSSTNLALTYYSSKIISVNDVIQGIRFKSRVNVSQAVAGPQEARLYSFNYGSVEEGFIPHTIPAGTFKDNVSSGVASVKIVDWEDGASLQWKATNATEDTGWQDFNIDGDTAYAKISDFTEFTDEPTEFVVKLIPKETAPTAGIPSVSGVGIILT